jgi:PKD repeat protein
MRSIRLLAATTVILLGVSACGDGGGGTSEDPTAAFTGGPCTVGVACAFTDASSDPQGATTITARSWDFNGDNTADVTGNVVNPSYSYAAAGTFTAKLTVTDDAGHSASVTHDIVVTTGTPNTNPVASFDLPLSCTAGTPCGFHSTSTDAEGVETIASWEWSFGDTGVGEGADVTHTYNQAGTYPVMLTVTDNQGGVGTVTQQLIVSAPTSQDCTTSGTQVTCSLTMAARSTLTFTLVSRSCELSGNTLRISSPFLQTVFFNLCQRNPGETYTVQVAGGGANQVFEAGSVVQVQLVQGTPDPGDPATGDPGIEISGGAPTWTLNIDDGGAAGTPGEPDFNDAVVTAQATAAP